MGLIQNPEASAIIRKQAGLTLSEGYPQNLLMNVQPVMDMTPSFHREGRTLGAATRTTSGTSTILTASETKKTFITGICLSIAKDATCDVAIGAVVVQCTQGSAARTLASIAIITTTLQSQTVYVPLDDFEIDEGSTIYFGTSTYTVGTMSRTATIYGYEL